MPNLVKNVVAGKPKATGGVLSGPLGTTPPTDAVTELAVAMNALGYISDEGVEETVGADTEKIKAWGGDTIKVLQTEHSVTYTFTFVEFLSEYVNREIYGDANVDVTPATESTGTQLEVRVKSDTLPHKVWCFEVRDGDAKVRIWLPDGQITERGDTTYADNSIAAYQVTLEAFPDSNGVKAYKFTDDGVLAPAGP